VYAYNLFEGLPISGYLKVSLGHGLVCIFHFLGYLIADFHITALADIALRTISKL